MYIYLWRDKNRYSSYMPKVKIFFDILHSVSKVSSPFLFLWLLSQMLTNFNNIW